MKLSFWKGKKHIGAQNTSFTYYSLMLQNVLIPRLVREAILCNSTFLRYQQNGRMRSIIPYLLLASLNVI
jgi:hypothetical protein